MKADISPLIDSLNLSGLFFSDYSFMFYKFSIPLETPAKKNSRINLRSGRSIPSKRYQDWHKAAQLQLLSYNLPKEPILQAVTITLFFTHGDLRRRDSDNGVSSILDLLTDCGILSDDNWTIVRKIEVLNAYEKNKPSCEITIESL